MANFSGLTTENRQLNKPKPVSWLDDLCGSISDEETFQKALEYGCAFRQSGKLERESPTKQ